MNCLPVAIFSTDTFPAEMSGLKTSYCDTQNLQSAKPRSQLADDSCRNFDQIICKNYQSCEY